MHDVHLVIVVVSHERFRIISTFSPPFSPHCIIIQDDILVDKEVTLLSTSYWPCRHAHLFCGNEKHALWLYYLARYRHFASYHWDTFPDIIALYWNCFFTYRWSSIVVQNADRYESMLYYLIWCTLNALITCARNPRIIWNFNNGYNPLQSETNCFSINCRIFKVK